MRIFRDFDRMRNEVHDDLTRKFLVDVTKTYEISIRREIERALNMFEVRNPRLSSYYAGNIYLEVMEILESSAGVTLTAVRMADYYDSVESCVVESIIDNLAEDINKLMKGIDPYEYADCYESMDDAKREIREYLDSPEKITCIKKTIEEYRSEICEEDPEAAEAADELLKRISVYELMSDYDEEISYESEMY